ncbi:MAG: LacI family transcriptional regulator [Microbacteriaceae bacterium]|nr:MAG: LacI family transcriptional regulator [Microbacteriaceae bacterium]
MGDKPVTLQEVARRAGVHPSTVSRALNSGGAQHLGAETVQRVKSIAAELGYEPNPWARNLRTRRSRMLGLVIPRLKDVVLADIFESAEDRARERGYQAVTASSRDDPGVQETVVQRLLDQRVDGFVLATPRIDDPILDQLSGRNVPFVLVNRTSGRYPCVRGDDELGGYLATQHLLKQGHRRVGIVAGPLNVSTSAGRLAGYRRAHAEHQLEVDESLIVEAADFAAESGATAAGRLLSRRDAPSALFCFNDSLAIGAMSVARDLGLDIPTDLAVVGFNDTGTAALLPVPLTSVFLPLGIMGREAVDMLLAMIDGEDPTSVVHAPRLTARSTSAHKIGTTASD